MDRHFDPRNGAAASARTVSCQDALCRDNEQRHAGVSTGGRSITPRSSLPPVRIVGDKKEMARPKRFELL
ncbi:MAG: hypothetical protein WCG92_24185, partial [Hyphomicrobiales bacterium]